MKTILAHWCYLNNFGDALNPYLLGKLSCVSIRYVNYTKPNFLFEIKKILIDWGHGRMYDVNRLKLPERKLPVVLGIGSILSRSLPNFYVWGAGFMSGNEVFRGGSCAQSEVDILPKC